MKKLRSSRSVMMLLFSTLLLSTLALYFHAKENVEYEQHSPVPISAETLSEEESFAWGTRVTLNLGIVRPSTKHEIPFSLVNDSSEDYEVESVQSKCSCSIANLSSQLIPAQSRVSGELIFQAAQNSGNYRKTVTILCLANSRPIRYEIVVNAIVQKQLEVKPSRLLLTANPGETRSHVFQVKTFGIPRYEQVTCKLVDLDNTGQLANVSLSEVSLLDTKERNSGLLELNVWQFILGFSTGTASRSPSRFAIQVTTQSKEGHKLIAPLVPVEVRVPLPVALYPNFINLHRPDSDEIVTKDLRVAYTADAREDSSNLQIEHDLPFPVSISQKSSHSTQLELPQGIITLHLGPVGDVSEVVRGEIIINGLGPAGDTRPRVDVVVIPQD